MIGVELGVGLGREINPTPCHQLGMGNTEGGRSLLPILGVGSQDLG